MVLSVYFGRVLVRSLFNLLSLSWQIRSLLAAPAWSGKIAFSATDTFIKSLLSTVAILLILSLSRTLNLNVSLNFKDNSSRYGWVIFLIRVYF